MSDQAVQEVRDIRDEEVPARNPDPRKSQQIAVVGKRGEGKTELAFLLFD